MSATLFAGNTALSDRKSALGEGMLILGECKLVLRVSTPTAGGAKAAFVEGKRT
jgi:hypothetical protein